MLEMLLTQLLIDCEIRAIRSPTHASLISPYLFSASFSSFLYSEENLTFLYMCIINHKLANRFVI